MRWGCLTPPFRKSALKPKKWTPNYLKFRDFSYFYMTYLKIQKQLGLFTGIFSVNICICSVVGSKMYKWILGNFWSKKSWNILMGGYRVCFCIKKSTLMRYLITCWKDMRTFLRTLLLCVVTSLGWDKGIFGICTFHIIPFEFSKCVNPRK